MICAHGRLLAILQDDDVWADISDDFTVCIPRETAATNLLATTTVLSPGEHWAWVIIPKSNVTFEVHTCVAKAGRGRKALQMADEATAYLFANTQAEKLISYVPEHNRKALLFTLRMGWRKEGFLTQSYMKDGQMIGQHVVGITKGEFLCQHSQQ